MVRRIRKAPIQQIAYPSSSVVLEAVRQEYQFELDRGAKLDTRVNMTITFAGVLFLYIIRFFNFNDPPRLQNSLLSWVLFAIQILAIAFYISSTFLLFLLLLNRSYRHFNCFNLLVGAPENSPDYREKDPSKLELYIMTEYLRSIEQNWENNQARAKRYNIAALVLAASIVCCFFLEFMNQNI